MTKPNLLLINPPVYDFSAYDLWSKPLGLLYIASVLRAQGCRVHWVDALDRWDRDLPEPGKTRPYHDGHYHKTVIEKPGVFSAVPRQYRRYGLPKKVLQNRVESIFRKHSIDAVMVTSGMTYWYPGVFEVIRLCKNIQPQVPVVLGGIYATLYPDHARRFSGADVVLAGQSENQVVDWIATRFDMISKNKYTQPDDLPLPAYDLYAETGHAALLTSRGCPYECGFCATRILNSPFIQRSPDSVIREIMHYAFSRNIRDIAFYDDALFVHPEKLIKPVLRSVVAGNACVRFHSPNGLFAKYIDRELAGLMMQAGFKTIRLSFETSDEARQKEMKKVSGVDLINAITYLEEAGFPRKSLKVYLLMGLTGQTLREVKDSIRFVHDLGVPISMSSYSPIPGTALWDKDIQQLPELENEPLLTNKSVYPIKSGRFTYEEFESIKSLVARGNRIIQGA